MLKKVVLFSFVFFCFLFLANQGFAKEIGKQYKLQVPDFSLTVVNAKVSGYKTVSLSGLTNLKGKTVLVNFFATWCPPCRAEIPMLVRFFNKHKKDNIVFIGITNTSSDIYGQPVKSFIKEFKVDYPVAYGSTALFGKYRIFGLPTSYIIKPNGHILKMQIGDLDHSMLNSMISKNHNETKKK